EKGLAGRLRGILQNSQRFVQRLVADEIHHDRNLTGTDAGVTENSPCFHCLLLLSYLPAVLPPAWPENFRVVATPPSSWANISSVTRTGTCLRTSSTAKVWPTNSGKMVEARLQVLTTLFLPLSFMASTFFIREGRP